MSFISQILKEAHFLDQHGDMVKADDAAHVRGTPGFNAAGDAANLDKAIKAKGVDEATITQILAKRNPAERQLIKSAYQHATGKSLEDALKKDLSGNLETVILALLKTPAQYDALELKYATKGLGTDEITLIEILVSRNNKEIHEINQAYRAEFKTELSKDISSDTSGDFQKALLALAKGERSEDTRVNDALVDTDARVVLLASRGNVVCFYANSAVSPLEFQFRTKELYEAGERNKGTNMAPFITVLTSRSIPHLRKVFQRYPTYSKHDTNKALDLELKGDIEKCLIAIVQCAVSKPAYFAEQLFSSMKGSGTQDKQLMRLMVSRSGVDLSEIKVHFKRMYGKTLEQAILEETKDDYQSILLALSDGSH